MGPMIVAILAFVAVGMPIALGLGLAATTLIFSRGFPLLLVPLRMFNALDSVILLAIPLFILAGGLIEAGGIGRQLVKLADALTGRLRGGIGYANIITGVFFAEISGVGVADAIVLTKIFVSEMVSRGYNKRFACGLTSASAALGIIIPPSVPMVVFGAATGTSVSALFAGGLLVGLILACFFGLVNGLHAHLRRLPATSDRYSLRVIGHSFQSSSWALAIPVIVLGGILGGIFTPTEAAVVAVIVSFAVALLAYRQNPLRSDRQVLAGTVRQTGIVMLVVAATAPLAWYFTNEQIDQNIARFLLSISNRPQVILLIIGGGVLLLGMFLQAVPIILTTMPLLMPVLKEAHIHPVHFGIVMVLLLSIGQQTPPVCTVLMAVSAVAKEPIGSIFLGMIPFLLAMLAMVVLVIFFPGLALWLPQVLGMID